MDFLRAVAILLVILAHSVFSYGAPTHLAPLQFGGTGVDLFFVLSGWLLGGLLFKEAETQGQIDVKRFWIRRWMRTFPAYYAVLLLQVGQRYLTKDDVNFPWEYFVFIQNYSFPLEFFSISWSLAVEEQFYLFIAPLLFFLTRMKKAVTTSTLLMLLILPFVFRHMELYNDVKETHVRLDGCLMGVFLAHIYHQYRSFWLKISRITPCLALVSVVIYFSFIVGRYYPELGISDPDKLLLAMLFGVWVMAVNANKYWSNALYIPGSYYIATRSYALYLLHPEILALLKRFFIDIPFPMFFALALIGSLILAEILYRCVEKPVMDYREQLECSSSSGRGKRSDGR
ncbi:MAG: acyltransferase [Gammaproteobacteria bacterium]|nr:acyltransferase [Gammaproteobacteria bacterium]